MPSVTDSHRGQWCPPGNRGPSLETFLIVITGGAVASSGRRPGVLPHIVQCRGQPPIMENSLAQNVNRAEVEKPCSKLTQKTESRVMEGGLQVAKHLPSHRVLLLDCKVSQMDRATWGPASWRVTTNLFPYHVFSVASFLLVSTMKQSGKAFLELWQSRSVLLCRGGRRPSHS